MRPCCGWPEGICRNPPNAQGVYHALFLEHSPIGADAQRALAAMKQWGLNPAVRNLDALRAQWKALHEYSRVSDGLDAAGVSSLAVRVGLFEDDAPELSELDERLHAMLDVTPLFALEDCWTELASRGASDPGHAVRADSVARARAGRAEPVRRAGRALGRAHGGRMPAADVP